jgi:putative nucleotidyltransferase with HDIG domain
MSDAVEQAIVARVQRGDIRVPAWPRSTHKLQTVLSNPAASVADVVKVLRSDDVLAGTTLRLANSAFYARGSAVTSLAAAVARLGMKELHRLGVASAAARVFAGPGPLAGLRQRAWRHALVEAAICEKLAQLAGTRDDEASFLGGLLHDIGRVLAIAALEQVGAPPDLEECWTLVDRLHVELGMVLAAKWKLPADIETLISDHHARTATDAEPVLKRVQIADAISKLMETSASVSAERLASIPELDPGCCAELAHALPRLPELIEAFSGEAGHSAPAVAAPFAPAAAPSARTLLICGGPVPIPVELMHTTHTSMRVRAASAGKVNWLVQVKAEDLSFWANVTASAPVLGGGHEWTLKPFAMAPDVEKRWLAFAGELSAAA